MKVLDWIYHQSCCTANHLDSQPTTFWFFEIIAPHTEHLVAIAVHCILSENAMRIQLAVLLLQAEHKSKCFSFKAIDVTVETTALIFYSLVASSMPLFFTVPFILWSHSLFQVSTPSLKLLLYFISLYFAACLPISSSFCNPLSSYMFFTFR